MLDLALADNHVRKGHHARGMVAPDSRVKVADGECFVVFVMLEVSGLGGFEHPEPIAPAVMRVVLGNGRVVTPEGVAEPPGRVAPINQEREAGRIWKAAGVGTQTQVQAQGQASASACKFEHVGSGGWNGYGQGRIPAAHRRQRID